MLLARALVTATSSVPLPSDSRVEGEAFTVTNDEHIPFWDLRRLVADVAGITVEDEDVRCIPFWLIQTIALISS